MALQDQWKHLVVAPLSNLGGINEPIYVVVIDALDECENDGSIRIILRLLAQLQSLKNLRIRIVVTSRPEVPIRLGFNQLSKDKHLDFALHDIEPSIVDHDLLLYFHINLQLIGEEDGQDHDWPGDQNVRTLVKRAEGLFIWAATACKFLRNSFLVEESLELLLQEHGAGMIAPEAHLNEIYLTVLRKSVQPTFSDREKTMYTDLLRNVLGSVVALSSPLTADSLATLLNIPIQRIDRALKNLYAILDLQTTRTRVIRLHHPSFRDFLLDHNRCNDLDFWVDEKLAHHKLFEDSLKLMSSMLKTDICEVRDPGRLVAEMDSIVIAGRVPPELQYACLNWAQHLQKSAIMMEDNGIVHQFLQKHLLHWIEALCWIQRTAQAIITVSDLETLSRSQHCSSLTKYLYDTRRFILFNQIAIEESPLQIYCSSLTFAPLESVVRAHFENQIPRWISKTPDLPGSWDIWVQTLHGHEGYVTQMAFSPDAKSLASLSSLGIVRVWDILTGASLVTLDLFPGREDFGFNASAIAFSPNQPVLAVAMGEIQIWSSDTWEVLQTLDRQVSYFCALSFSPDGRLACASDNGTIQIWNIITGAILKTLETTDQFSLPPVAFSPDGKYLASGNDCSEVKLWDATSGQLLSTILLFGGVRRPHSQIDSVAFSVDSKHLAIGANRAVRRGSGSVTNSANMGVMDVETRVLRQFYEGEEKQKKVTFLPNGDLVSQAYDTDCNVRVWRLDTGEVIRTMQCYGDSREVATSSDGLLAFTPDENQISILRMPTETDMMPTRPPADLYEYDADIIFSADGRRLAMAAADHSICLYEFDKELLNSSKDHVGSLVQEPSSTRIRRLKGHNGAIEEATFSPDGQRLAASTRNTVKIWDTTTAEVLTPKCDAKLNRILDFSPDSKSLAFTGRSRSSIDMWNLATQTSSQLECDWDIDIVAFSPDCKYLAGASHLGIMLWYLTAKVSREVATVKLNAYPHAIAFSSCARLLAHSLSRYIELYEVDSGDHLQSFSTYDDVIRMSFTADRALLNTNHGWLPLGQMPQDEIAAHPEVRNAIMVKDGWILKGLTRVLRLPSQYRPIRTAVHGNRLVLYVAGHSLLFLEFAFQAFEHQKILGLSPGL